MAAARDRRTTAAPARAGLHVQRTVRLGPRGDGAPVPREQPDVALAEIACLLGFSDQSAFDHAFKRWTGGTPREARHRAMGFPAPPPSDYPNRPALAFSLPESESLFRNHSRQAGTIRSCAARCCIVAASSRSNR